MGGKKGSQLGYKFYNNGVITIRLRPGAEIPNGYVPGMILKNPEQAKENRRKSLQNKYGVDNVSQLQEVKDKKRKSSLEKYGTECTFQSNEVKEKCKSVKLARYGDEKYNNKEKLLDTISKRTLEEQQLINIKRDITNIERYGKPNFCNPEKAKQTMIERYGVENPSQIPHIAIKKSAKCKASDGTLLDSNWELDVYEYCLRNNIPIKRIIPIEYEYNDKKHITHIDFEIDGMLFEVKGSHLLKGCFDYARQVPIDKKLDVYKENNVVLITPYNKIFDENNGLIGVDIELFRDKTFTCGDTHSLNNEKSRWKAIINCIKHKKGFVDEKLIMGCLI